MEGSRTLVTPPDDGPVAGRAEAARAGPETLNDRCARCGARVRFGVLCASACEDAPLVDRPHMHWFCPFCEMDQLEQLCPDEDEEDFL